MKLSTLSLLIYFIGGSNGFLWSQSLDFFSLSRVLLIYGNKQTDYDQFSLSTWENILKSPRFDSSKKTVLYIHGFKQEIDDENIRSMISAYQQRPDYNTMILDWTAIGNGSYLIHALPRTTQFSHVLVDSLKRLFEHGLDIQKFHLVSHSLGSQLAGMIGRGLQKVSNGRMKLKRITCLDPAYMGFYFPVAFLQPVNKNDAEFVDIIHTDVGYGTAFATGTVDFYPNGLSLRQPGCPSRNFEYLSPRNLCSHWRSWRFWIESLLVKSSKFLANKCDMITFSGAANCDYSNSVSMGINCPTGITGKYYLKTRSNSPYSY